MSEKVREEFEEWCDDNGFASDRYELRDLGEKYKHLCGEYVIPDSRIMWMAWQASRAALVVELPQKPYCAQGIAYPDYSDALNDCREAIESVGVKCK